MADVTLTEYECRKGLLPAVCLQCGEPAAVTVKRKFSWYPQWIIVLVLVNVIVAAIVAAIMTKKMLVEAPMCDQHRNHWSKRTMWILVTLGIAGLIGAAGIAFLADQNGQADGDVIGGVCFGGVLALLAWLVVVIVCQSSMIRAKEITEEAITLTKVHPHFADALEDDRAQDEEDDAIRPKSLKPKKPRPRDEDDQPQPKKKPKKNDPWYDDE